MDHDIIAAYLGVPSDGPEMAAIAAPGPEHLARVAALVETLARARRAVGASQPPRRREWVHRARVVTSRGVRTPLEILSDPELTREALADPLL